MFKHCMFGIRQNTGVYVEGLKDPPPPQLISTCFGIISDFYDRENLKGHDKCICLHSGLGLLFLVVCFITN